MTNTRKILVTSALPYANGEIHLGHMVEYIQTDIWVRFQKLLGHQCLYICGSDAHGTPIMISAEKAGIAPEKMIAEISQKQQAVFSEFSIGFDNFYTTHSEENKELASYIYLQLQKRGDIIIKKIEQAYDPVKNMFLPDRYVKGECPKCHAKDQYGDSCEVCGATYSPAELINAVSVLSGATPITKESEHYFFCLENYEEMLRTWTRAGHLQEQIINKLNEWLETGLQAWDISRDAPYFGFEIPNTKDKYFYVWLDAPIGYMASLKNLCERNKNISFDDFFAKDSDAELYHFVGKDIVYFHALFWPAMLHGAGFRTPTAIFAHGFLTVDGQKMSKSRGTFINGRDYLNHFDPEQLRYYFAAKLTNRVEDIDLNLEDFMSRINSDLVGKLVNIASRCAGFIHKFSDGLLADKLHNPELFQYCVDAGYKIYSHYEAREYNQAIRVIMECADKTNQYIDEHKPWSLAKQEGQEKNVQAICSQGINLFRLLMIYLKPVLPKMAEKVETFLNISPIVWDDHRSPLLNHRINNFELLMKRIDSTQISALREANKI